VYFRFGGHIIGEHMKSCLRPSETLALGVVVLILVHTIFLNICLAGNVCSHIHLITRFTFLLEVLNTYITNPN
jgi:hypothetical protein